MTYRNEGLTPEDIRALLIDGVERDALDLSDDDLYDLLPLIGEVVFSLRWACVASWVSAGTERVYRVAGKYLLVSDSFGWTGPYDALDKAYGSIFVSEATQEIECSEWDEDEIIARMQLSEPPSSLVINGNEWPLERLEHRHAHLHGRWQRSTSSGAPEDDETPELMMQPAIWFDDGTPFLAQPPEVPAGIPERVRRDAAWQTLEGEASLERETRDLPRAELRFRAALELYLEHLTEPHPRLSYILDRIGIACHLQGRLVEAEAFYRRSLEILEVQDGPTRWNGATLINLARLLDSQGRDPERDECLELYQALLRDDEGAE